MKYAEHCDERAKKFFHQGYVGPASGEDGTPYATFWDSSDADLEETSMYAAARTGPRCVYCGNRGYAIQPWISSGDYSTRGHACICKGAMDEIEHRDQVKKLRAQHARELRALQLKGPQPSLEVAKTFQQAIIAKMRPNELMASLGVTVSGQPIPQDFFQEPINDEDD
jgi:hypothetical protein